METSKNTSFIQLAHHIGIFFVLLFTICVIWYYLRPVEQDLHLNLFKLAFFGFEEMNITGMILGAVQAYLWAYVGLGLWKITQYIPSVK